MSTDTKKKTTKKNPDSGDTLTQLEKIIAGGGSLGGGGATATVPGVTSTEAGDVVTFSLPHQKTEFAPTPADITTNAKGDSTMTFANFVQQIHNLQGDKAALEQVQTQLHAAGYLTKNWANYGTLDSATVTAWKQLGTDAVNSNISAMSLLAAGSNAPDLVSDMQAVQEKISTANEQAAAVATPTTTLTDPNEVAQAFAAAMESIGGGAPTKDQVNKFVNAFINGPQGQIAAERNEVESEKTSDLSGSQYLQTELSDLQQGKVGAANTVDETGAVQGPVDVATKAEPNLDAEAMAAAKNANPAQYAATGTSFLYGLIQKMLGGDLSQPTTPTAPSATAPGGAIVTTPITGAP